MKIQRILQATFKKERGDEQFQIVMVFTDDRSCVKKFATWQYVKGTGYNFGRYFSSFKSAYKDFAERCSRNGGANFEYCARQIGEAEIVWETL